ncbi:MAG: CoA-binding protein [Desulfitobacteriia bacterium]|jgi:predicted CoA-binding protein
MSEKIMLEKKVWAVVGVPANPQKYGYRLYQKLKKDGYKVYAVNPLFEAIGEDKCYKDLSSLPEIPQVVNMVVSPKRGKAIIEEAAKLGVKYAWFQPGSFDEELLKLTEKLGIQSVQACVLVSAK